MYYLSVFVLLSVYRFYVVRDTEGRSTEFEENCEKQA